MFNRHKQGFHSQTWAEAAAELTQGGEPFVLVTLLGTTGSTPRAAGTKMVVTADDIYDTVGGGHLEFSVIEKARTFLLAGEQDQRIEHIPLGASLGQCCGGSVSVLFECIAQQRLPIDIYGAGHVAHALIPLLATLPVKVRWIDSRADLFTKSVPNNVTVIVDEFPEDQVRDARINTAYFVLTHNHQLDFVLCERILNRDDRTFLGLIGSQTKATRFRMRLAHKNISEDIIDTMTCPVGLSNIQGKRPMEVALSIAGQITQLYHTVLPEQKAARGLQWQQLKNTLVRTPGPEPVESDES